jgi:ribosome-binding protein aMBF1 (putative translation factor)
MGKMKFYSEEEALKMVLGEQGTSARDIYEEDMSAFIMGETIRKARQSRNLTQEELGALIGVKKAQISRLERGYNNMTLSTISRVFRALGITSATLDLGIMGKIALWG